MFGIRTIPAYECQKNVEFGLRMKAWKQASGRHERTVLAGRAGRIRAAGCGAAFRRGTAGGAGAQPPKPRLLMDEPSVRWTRRCATTVVDLRMIVARGADGTVRDPRPAQAFAIADRIALMNAGQFKRWRTCRGLPPPERCSRRVSSADNYHPGRNIRDCRTGSFSGDFTASSRWHYAE